jgi:hypothetical protein
VNDIARHFSSCVITANSSAATTSGNIPFGPFAGGVVVIASTGSATQINWHGTPSMSVTPRQIYADGSAVTSSLTVGCINIPDACFAVPFVVPVLVGGTTCAMTALLKG